MANIDRVVFVQIALRSRGVNVQGFSDGMLIDQHERDSRFEWITGPDELLEGWGLDVDDDLYKAAQTWFSQIPRPRRLGIGRRLGSELIDAALAAVRTVNNDWYGFTPVAHNVNDVTRAAQWAEAQEKLHFTTLSDPNILAGSSAIANTLRDGQFFRTAWWYNEDPNAFNEVASMARGFSVLPGGESWAMLELAGTPLARISETGSANIKAVGGNTFEMFAGVGATQYGQTAAREYIDVIRFRDWQAEEIRTRCFKNQLNRRIPYTDTGINLFKTWVSEALSLGRDRKGIAEEMVHPSRPNIIIPSFVVTAPARATISPNQVASRVLTDVNFTARLAGSIHQVEIRGELSYDNIG